MQVSAVMRGVVGGPAEVAGTSDMSLAISMYTTSFLFSRVPIWVLMGYNIGDFTPSVKLKYIRSLYFFIKRASMIR